MTTDPSELRIIAEEALELVPEGGTLGLGTGHAASAFLRALGEKVQAGLQVRGVPTSRDSADLAAKLGIPLTTLDECPQLDVDFDGADEVDPDNNLIKGYGGALVREKIVAAASKKLVILVGPEKIVPRLGSRGKLPVEVVPFALSPCSRALQALACEPHLRRDGSQPHVTDNGNYILDCDVTPIEDPTRLEAAIRAIPGVVGTGLFLKMNPTVLIGLGQRVEVREAK
ncbi:MAG: ribose-5-phosphate isomerase RpiA [Planctomycetota bacterium]|nr:MAG: ribose-5-phosphate isomerase RpiA [Planctomycetota bacterium]